MKNISIKAVISGLLIMIVFWSCEKTEGSPLKTFDEDEINTRIDSLANFVSSLSVKIDSLEIITGTPTFTKYVYTGEGDPWNLPGHGVELPFVFDERDCDIVWWGCSENNGECWWRLLNNEGVLNNIARGSGHANTISWKCIVIDYGQSE